MGFVNRVEIGGRAVKDAVRIGKGPYRFSIACGGGKKRGSDEHWPTEYFDVSCWSTDAERIHRGDEVLVVGHLRQFKWERDGRTQSRVEIVATQLPALEPPLTPKYPIPEHPPCERKVTQARPVTEADPITDEEPW